MQETFGSLQGLAAAKIVGLGEVVRRQTKTLGVGEGWEARRDMPVAQG